MPSPVALVICLVVLAGAAADVVPTLDTADGIDPAPAGGLPFLDYEDPPQSFEPTQDGPELNSEMPEEEEPAQEAVVAEEPVVREEGSLFGEDLSEEPVEEAAEAELAVHDSSEVAEQPEVTDAQDEEQQSSDDHAEHRDDGHQHHAELANHVIPAERPTKERLQAPSAERPSSSGAWATSPVSFSVKEEGSVVLPCGRSLTVEPVGDLDAISWFHSGRLLVGGDPPASSDERYELSADGSLRLTSAVTQDGGMFTCRVYGADGTVTETRHQLHVLTQPREGARSPVPALRVVTEPSDGIRVVQRGQPASLACWPPGEPRATVTWTKQEGTLPYGETSLRGPRLEIGQVDRTHSGTYRCTVTTSDNRTVVTSLQLQVNFAPEVTALESVVYTGEDHQAVMRCQVFSHPPAEVQWRRPSGRPLRPGHHLTDRAGDLFSLTLLVEKDDLDTYICTASNIFGSGEAAIDLTGRPGRPVMTSPVQGSKPQTYTLSWRTPSVLPLLAYKLLYRKHVPEASRPKGLWRTAWREAILPLDDVDDGAEGGDHIHQYVIRDLEPDSQYDVRLLAHNRHGWGEPSAGFRFRTAWTSGADSAVSLQNGVGVAGVAGGNSASSVRAGTAAAALLLGTAIRLMLPRL